MSPPSTQHEISDREVMEACAAGHEEGLRLLRERYGPLIEAVVVRVVDERRSSELEEVRGCVDTVTDHLRACDAEALTAWDGRCTLRHYLALLARQVALAYLQDITPPATLIASLPAPAALFLDEELAPESARRLADTLDRMSPNITALVRLRLRGVDRVGIGTTLGIPASTIVSNLEHVAERLAEAMDDREAVAPFRVLLDAAPMAERVEVALRTEGDPAYGKMRAVAEGAWRAVREGALNRLHTRGKHCLDEVTTAAFVDGSVKGSERTRTEGHVAGCARCTDTVATLVVDMHTANALKNAAGLNGRLSLAAALASTARYRAAEVLAEAAAAAGDERAADIVRLARVGQALVGGRPPAAAVEPSRVVQTHIPSDEEAPIAALEALLLDDVHTAARAIDDELAKGTLGTRLRLLTWLRDFDLAAGHSMARDLLARSHSDPGLLSDAEAGVALPPGRTLPREILLERIGDMLPSAVRYSLSR